MPQTPSTTPWSPSLAEGGLITAFPYLAKVGFAVSVCYGRSKPLPYPKLFVSLIELRLAVIVLNGTSVPYGENGMFR